ncbi:MAG: gliding motility-associated C-terminal domain-containing protein [Candidatus Cyclobacteriaceae bacterium M3_2C_046]
MDQLVKNGLLVILLGLGWMGHTGKTKDYKPARMETGLKFIENKNQWDPEVLFRADIPGGKLYIIDDGLVYSFYDREKISHKHDCHTCEDQKRNHTQGRANITNPDLSEAVEQVDMHAFKVEFTRANSAVKVLGIAAYPETYNYFKGSEPSGWASGVKAYQAVIMQNIYSGIDLKLYQDRGHLKYDFIIKKGADPNQIRLRYKGVDQVHLQDHQLQIGTIFSTLKEQIPLAYQLDQQDTMALQCSYQLDQDEVSFKFNQGYDPDKTLVIDPILIFSTFSGSVADNWGNTATFDEAGNLYSGGIVNDFGFPVTLGAYQQQFDGIWDVAILKYDSTGTQLEYATYLGGSFAETPQSLIVNNQGELLIFGTTSSPDFPIKNAYDTIFKGGSPSQALNGVQYSNGSDIYLAKLSAEGNQLISATYLGGTANDGINYTLNPLVKNYGDQFRGDVLVDQNDYVYVASNTNSEDFPLQNPFQDSFGGGTHDGVVFKMSPDLSQLIWSSYLGGDNTDAAYSVKINDSGTVYVAGGTRSTDFFTTSSVLQADKPGDIDGFVVAIDQNIPAIKYSSYIGTQAYDQVYFIDLDHQGYIYLLGQTQGAYPVKSIPNRTLYSVANSGQFIQKLTPTLTLDDNCFSTVFGSGSGSPDISLTAFLVNECGNLFVSGWGGNINSPIFQGLVTNYIGGSTENLPVTRNAFQSETDGSDFYLMVLHQNAQALMYATFFGGNAFPGEHVDGGTSRFDKRGIVYQAVCAGCFSGGNSDFPTTEGAWSRVNNSENCNNAAFKFDLASLGAAFTTNSPVGDQPGLREGCFPLEVMFINQSLGGRSFFWEFGNGLTSNQPDSVVTTYEEPGIYQVTLIAYDNNTCQRLDIATGFISVFDQDFSISPSDTICFGQDKLLTATGGISYQWGPAEFLSNEQSANPLARPDSTTTFYLEALDQNGCRYTDSVTIAVIPEILVDFEVNKSFDCIDLPDISLVNLSQRAERYFWDFGNGLTSVEENPVYKYEKEGEYSISLTAFQQQCSNQKIREVTVNNQEIPNVITPNGDEANQFLIVNTHDLVGLEVFNRWGNLVYQNENYQNNWSATDLSNGVYYYVVTFADQHHCNGYLHVIR